MMVEQMEGGMVDWTDAIMQIGGIVLIISLGIGALKS